MFALEQITIIRAPMRAPGANAPEHGWRPRVVDPEPRSKRSCCLGPWSSVVAASTSAKSTLSSRTAEPITTVITYALARATEGFTTGALSSHAGTHNVQRSDLLLSRLRQLGVTVGACLGARIRNRQAIATVNRRDGLNGRDAPLENDPIVTQFVTHCRVSNSSGQHRWARTC